MKKLVNLHKDLFDISQQKTVIVKEGAIEKLQVLLVKERKSIRTIEQAENERQTAVEEWFTQKQLPLSDAAITNMLGKITDERETEELENITILLTELITKLKQQEQLNQALINQSMQFVQLSLDMMNPSIKNMNYGNKKGSKSESDKLSVFDSKA